MAISFNKTQKLVGASAIAALLAGGVYLVAPQSTFSSWHDSDEVAGAVITNGNLDIEADEATTGWFDVSEDIEGNPKAISSEEFRLVPGDVIQYRAGFKVALEGDNLKARLTAENPLASGPTLRDPNGVTMSLAIYKTDENGAPTGDPLVKSPMVAGEDGKFKAQESIDVNLTPEDVDMKQITPESKSNYVGVFELTFDVNTPDRELVMDQTTIDDYTMSLTQVR